MTDRLLFSWSTSSLFSFWNIIVRVFHGTGNSVNSLLFSSKILISCRGFLSDPRSSPPKKSWNLAIVSLKTEGVEENSSGFDYSFIIDILASWVCLCMTSPLILPTKEERKRSWSWISSTNIIESTSLEYWSRSILTSFSHSGMSMSGIPRISSSVLSSVMD